jgi:hypothetical protein
MIISRPLPLISPHEKPIKGFCNSMKMIFGKNKDYHFSDTMSKNNYGPDF